MIGRYRETLKKSEGEKFTSLMLGKLYQSVLSGNKLQAGIISKSIKILFPKTKDVVIADTIFRALWQLDKHEQAIKVYIKAGRPFWLSETIGRYYEKKGLMNKAMREYDLLINEYLKIRLLPLPNGPPELYKVGRWYAYKNKAKARQYLKLYLSAEDRFKSDPALYLRHKNEARKILNKLEAVRRKRI